MNRRFIADRLSSNQRDLSNEPGPRVGPTNAGWRPAVQAGASCLSYRRIGVSPIEARQAVRYRLKLETCLEDGNEEALWTRIA